MADILIGNVKGPQGETGATGAQGAQGEAATIAVGSVTTVPYGQNARVTNSGTSEEAVFDFVIPQGRPGEQTTKLDNLTIDAITEPATQFPTPAVGDNGSTLFGKISKWFSDMIQRVNTINVAMSAIKGLQTTTVLNQSAQISKAGLAELDIGTYIVQCSVTPSDFPTSTAYGMLVHYGSLNNYHYYSYNNGSTTFTLNASGSSMGTWTADALFTNLTLTSDALPITIARNNCVLFANQFLFVDVVFTMTGTPSQTTSLFWIPNRTFIRSSDLVATRMAATTAQPVQMMLADGSTSRIGANGTSLLTNGTSWCMQGTVFLSL